MFKSDFWSSSCFLGLNYGLSSLVQRLVTFPCWYSLPYGLFAVCIIPLLFSFIYYHPSTSHIVITFLRCPFLLCNPLLHALYHSWFLVAVAVTCIQVRYHFDIWKCHMCYYPFSDFLKGFTGAYCDSGRKTCDYCSLSSTINIVLLQLTVSALTCLFAMSEYHS